MKCTVCAAENRTSARFCRKCGAELTLLCMKCGVKLPLDAEFCDACGTRVAALSPLATPGTVSERVRRLIPKEYGERLLATRGRVGHERRLVTILFSDVKGSTIMAGQLGSEDWADIRTMPSTSSSSRTSRGTLRR